MLRSASSSSPSAKYDAATSLGLPSRPCSAHPARIASTIGETIAGEPTAMYPSPQRAMRRTIGGAAESVPK